MRYVHVLAAAAGALALLGAITGPSFRDAGERGRQRRTMSDIRALGTAIETYQVAHGFVPAADSLDSLDALLVPTYIERLPRVDGWGTPLRFQSWCVDSGILCAGPPNGYVVRSAASDACWDHEDVADYAGGASADPRRDIVFGGLR